MAQVSGFLTVISKNQSCLAFGATLIKFLQMIDVLSLMLYIPIHLTIYLHDFLSGIAEISDPVHISP